MIIYCKILQQHTHAYRPMNIKHVKGFKIEENTMRSEKLYTVGHTCIQQTVAVVQCQNKHDNHSVHRLYI